MMKLYIILILLSLVFCHSFAKDQSTAKDQAIKESQIVDFNSIKEVLKNDGLSNNASSKSSKVRVYKRNRVQSKKRLYNIPSENEFWSFISEYWLVKNAPVLKWDFKKPDYGLETSFAALLESLGHYEKKFKILLINTPNVTHFSLPSDRGEYIFLVSVPFIRQMDLSKLEISLIMFEDFIRSESNLFKSKVSDKKLKSILGTNFYGSKLDVTIFEKLLKKYDDIVFDSGFSFQEQFEITKNVGTVLKNDLKLWNAYNGLIKKIDGLVKTNVLYKEYAKIYPSPEMQLNWLNPIAK